MRTAAVILAVIVMSALVNAQTTSASTANHAGRSQQVGEKVLIANQERMYWEAMQSASLLAAEHRVDPAEHHPVHIDTSRQPTPEAPKLRREWLAPADESSKLVSEK